MPSLTDEEFADEIRRSAEDAEDVPPRDRADRAYDRIRRSIERYLEQRGSAVGTVGEFLMLVPDVFILLWRLANDKRVGGKNKMLLGSAIAYYVFPFDFMPEGIVGPMGYLDDLVFAVIVLNKVIGEVDESVIREHWSGKTDVLDSIKNVLNAAENLVGTDVFSKVKKAATKR
jgi:uncharacterized membrane protein YkvA (DUF1232 family)